MSINLQANGQSIRKIIADAEKQTWLMLSEIEKAKSSAVSRGDGKNPAFSPRSLSTGGNLTLVSSSDWTSGFFPGNLWLLYELTGNELWADRARLFTTEMEKEKLNAKTHDMGFKIWCSFGNGFRLKSDPVYREIIIESARTLSTRFNPLVGCIRSWDHNADKWKFPVIVDNLMNLELLFAATRFTGDSSFFRIAVSHANTTLRNHYRPDNSSFHVVDYDPATGSVIQKNTHQGLSDDSSWSRGQAWGLYGYTMCFRETGDSLYLKHAEKIAAYILNHPNLPDDLIPYWDFSLENTEGEPRDASAAAITASALFELCTLSEYGIYYHRMAEKMINSLAKNYRSAPGANRGFILDHSTGSKRGGTEIDVPLIYADYYFLEANKRQRSLKNHKGLAKKNN
ncbi:MAG: glycoside hydrolase family 88 protein [Bacteroidales bacterium]|nr:glycoside hydrolase family 88 protein [Bacteroidales bacterium]